MEWAVKGYFAEFHHTWSHAANMCGERELMLECEREGRKEREHEEDDKFRDKQMDQQRGRIQRRGAGET